MDLNDTWMTVHHEQVALLDDLETLDDGQWDVQSRCPAWIVHDLVAHLVHAAHLTRRGGSPQVTRQPLAQIASRRSAPPGPLDRRLVEAVVHGEDLRRPLGLTRRYPSEAVVRSLLLPARTPAALGGAKQRAARVRLIAVVTGRRVALADLDGAGVAALGAT